jgi:hypothetical protein
MQQEITKRTKRIAYSGSKNTISCRAIEKSVSFRMVCQAQSKKVEEEADGWWEQT